MTHVFIAGYPGIGGGADVELWHLCDAFRKAGIGVHLVPFGEPDRDVREAMDRLGCCTHEYRPDIFAGQVVLSFCNGEFLRRLLEIHANGAPKCVVWFDCMARQIYGQEGLRLGLIDYFGFQSRYQYNNHIGELRRFGEPRILEGYRPFFSWTRGTEEGVWAPGCACNRDPEKFTVGRLSRDDHSKFPDNLWRDWGKIQSPKPVRMMVMGYGGNARQRNGDPPEGAIVHPPYAMGAADFIGYLDVMIHNTGGSGENWPRVLFEAWASGVIPIFDRDSGAAEIIHDGEDGYLVRNGTEAAERASQIAQDDALRARLVKAGYETLLREHCDVERSVGPFLPLLEGCPEVDAPAMRKAGHLDLSVVRRVNDTMNTITRERARWMVAQFSIHDGQVYLDRHTHDFPDVDLAKAAQMFAASVGVVPEDQKPQDGKIRNLCVCEWGHSRSVCLAKLLQSKGQIAHSTGHRVEAHGGMLPTLTAWADRIFVLQAGYAEKIPEADRHKVIVLDVGPDVWMNPFHDGLRTKLDGMLATLPESPATAKPRPCVIGIHTYPGSVMANACRETWVPRARELDFEVLFYSGAEPCVECNGKRKFSQSGDMLQFPVETDYTHCSDRMDAWCRWLKINRPDSWLFDVDDDTVVLPARLLAMLPTAADYVGYPIDMGPGTSSYASGGAGMVLSPRAVSIIAERGLPSGQWNEDTAIGKALNAGGIELTHDKRFRPFRNSVPGDNNEPTRGNDFISGHCKSQHNDPHGERVALMFKIWGEVK